MFREHYARQKETNNLLSHIFKLQKTEDKEKILKEAREGGSTLSTKKEINIIIFTKVSHQNPV